MATATLLSAEEMLPLMEQLRHLALDKQAFGNLLPDERETISRLISAARNAGFTDLQIGVLVMTITQPLGRKQKDIWSGQLVRFLGE